jgi:hypothetical protein
MDSLYTGSGRTDVLQCIYGRPDLVKEGVVHREAEAQRLRAEAQQHGAVEKAHKEADLQVKRDKAQVRYERQIAEQKRCLRNKDKERKKWRTRIMQRTQNEQKQADVKRARAQKQQETNVVMMAYLQEYFILTEGSLTPSTIRGFLGGKDGIDEETATVFVTNLVNFCNVTGWDKSGRGGKKFDYESFQHFLICQARTIKPITDSVALELALMQAGLENTKLRHHMTDFNLKMTGDGTSVLQAADIETLTERAHQKAAKAEANQRDKEEAEALAAERAVELAEELRLEQLLECDEQTKMQQADIETKDYTFHLNKKIAKQKANQRLLQDKLIGVEETLRMRVEERHSHTEEVRFRQAVSDRKAASHRAHVERERQRLRLEAEIEERRVLNMGKRISRLAKGRADILAPCVREVEDWVWIKRTETVEEQMERQDTIRYVCQIAAMTAIMAATVSREATGTVFEMIAETIERQKREFRIQQFKEHRARAMDPEVEKSRQAIETQKMRKEELAMSFLVQREVADLRREAKEVREAAKKAAWKASLVSENARQAILQRIITATAWVSQAEDLAIIAKHDEAALVRNNELNEVEIRKKKAEAMAERQRQKKADIKARQDAVEVAAERHRISILQKQRQKEWDVVRTQNELRAVKDVEGEAGIRADLELTNKLAEWKVWAQKNGKSMGYVDSGDLKLKNTSFGRDVYVASNFRHTIPLGPVAALTPATPVTALRPVRTGPRKPSTASTQATTRHERPPRTKFVFPADERMQAEAEAASAS